MSTSLTRSSLSRRLRRESDSNTSLSGLRSRSRTFLFLRLWKRYQKWCNFSSSRVGIRGTWTYCQLYSASSGDRRRPHLSFQQHVESRQCKVNRRKIKKKVNVVQNKKKDSEQIVDTRGQESPHLPFEVHIAEGNIPSTNLLMFIGMGRTSSVP